MADDTEERQLDEFGFPIPTEEELEAERAKTDQVIQLSGAAQALENQLPSPAPLNLPVSSGRMYMGPSMTPEQETAFHALPSGSSINLVAPPTPEAAEGAAARVSYAGRTFGGGGPYDPAMERFRAQQAIQDYVAKGGNINDAVRIFGQDFFGPSTSPKLYKVGSNLVDSSGKVIASAPEPPAGSVFMPGIGLVNKQTGEVIRPVEETETVTETVPATEGSPGSPAIPASKGFLGIGAHPAVPEVPPTPARGEQRITRKVPVKKAAESKSQYKVGARYGNLRYKGGDPKLASSWEKV